MRIYPALVIRMLRSILLVSLDGEKCHRVTDVGNFTETIGSFFSILLITGGAAQVADYTVRCSQQKLRRV